MSKVCGYLLSPLSTTYSTYVIDDAFGIGVETDGLLSRRLIRAKSKAWVERTRNNTNIRCSMRLKGARAMGLTQFCGGALSLS